MRRTAALFLLLATAGCGLVDLVKGEPDYWAHSSVGYPFTAHYIGGYHARYTENGWEMIVGRDFPEPEGLREGVQAALDRWSKVLAATPVPPAPAIDPMSNVCGWGGEPLAPAGDSFAPGFHVLLYVGNGMFETNTVPTIAWYPRQNPGGCMGMIAGRPASGMIGLDADFDWSDFKRTENVIVHEIGHALGFVSPFDTEGALAFARSRASVYYAPTRVPLVGSHWEWCMAGDIMTDTATDGDIGDITIEAMIYDWLYDPGDMEYSLQPTLPDCWRTS